jgi:NDP-sugar pyrophosphorylase family protein
MIEIVVPMGGGGKKFTERGFTFPKPLVEIDGRPMIELVVENLRPSEPHRFTFVCRQEHLQAFALRDVLELIAPGCNVVSMPAATAGALCSVLLAAEFLSSDHELLVANADQQVDVGIDAFLAGARRGGWDGYVMTFPSTHPKWSFVRLEGDLVVATAEKRPISQHATVGLYYFRQAMMLLDGAERMLEKNASVDGQFYVCPVYNELILAGRRVSHYPIAREQMHSLGTPEDLEAFVARRPAPSA